jgi:hypothetical protein
MRSVFMIALSLFSDVSEVGMIIGINSSMRVKR